MNIEELNKSQIILLTLLTSFVTSIATGIVTVSLMDQAPPGMTHTISKVVEKTIETVVPEKTQGSTVVKTIVVEKDDALVEAVAKNKQSLVRIKKAAIGEDGEDEFIALGFVVSEDGMVVTDSALVGADIDYLIVLGDGSEFSMSVVDQTESVGIAILSPNESVDTLFTPVAFANESTLSLGETVITLSGISNNKISSGFISNLKMSEREVAGEEDEGSTTESYLYAIYTNITLKKYDSGSMLFDVSGNIAGMNLVRDANVFTVPSGTIEGFIYSSKLSLSEADTATE
ncbi:serine protease [Patescibacteria group bacterium]